MGGMCRARNCYRSKEKCPELTFFSFPTNPISRKKWLKNIGDQDLQKRAPSFLKNSVLCSLHFEEECFVSKNKRALVKNAVPTLFNIPPYKSEENQKKKRGKVRVTSVSSEKTSSPVSKGVSKGGRIFSCDVETIDNWHRHIDAATEQLLMLLPEGNKDAPCFTAPVVKNFVDAYTQYDDDKPAETEFEEKIKHLNDGFSSVPTFSEITPELRLLCRLCSNLIHRECVVPLFSLAGERMNLETMINSVLSVKIVRDDGMPQQVCNLCIKKLTLCYDLKSEFLSSDRKLRQVLGMEDGNIHNVDGKLNAGEKNLDSSPPVPVTSSKIMDDVGTAKQKLKSVEKSKDTEIKSARKKRLVNVKKVPEKKRKIVTELSKKIKENVEDKKESEEENMTVENVEGDDSDFENDSSYEIQWYDEAYDDSISEDAYVGENVVNRKKGRIVSEHKLSINDNMHQVTESSSDVKNNDTENGQPDTPKSKSLHKIKDDVSNVPKISVRSTKENNSQNSDGKMKTDTINPKRGTVLKKQKSLKIKFNSHAKILKQGSKKLTKISCAECKKVFPSKWKLDRHIHVHRKFECVECGKPFKNGDDLLKHTKVHLASNRKSEMPLVTSFSCGECAQVFKTRAALVLHSRIHKTAVPFSCNVCPKAFPTRISLKQHLKSHKSQKCFKCLICGERFNSNKELICHRIKHSRVFRCEICGIEFAYDEELQKHKDEHHLEDSDLQLNGLADVSLRQEADSNGELKSGLSDEIVTNVDTDNTSKAGSQEPAKDGSILKVKVPYLEKIHIIQSSDQYVCEICDCKFSTKFFQEEHKKTYHISSPPKDSSELTTSVTESNAELVETPERGKLYFCDQCGEGYERKRSLALHRFSHNSTHRCPHCNQTFSVKESLTRHLDNCIGVKEEETF